MLHKLDYSEEVSQSYILLPSENFRLYVTTIERMSFQDDIPSSPMDNF